MSIIIPSVLLYLFGLLNLFGAKPSLTGFFVVLFVLGVLLAYITHLFGLTFLERNAKALFWLSVGLLAITFVVGLEVKGSRRWIDLYFFNVQPAEFVKLTSILYFANIFATLRSFQRTFGMYLMLMAQVGIPAIIIFFQPDLGSSIVVLAIFFTLYFFSFFPKRYFFYTILAFVLVAPIGFFGLRPYQRERITSFFVTHSNKPSASSYNMIQALIATGSGQFFGRGLGQGKQSTLAFLPEYHTDFAFSTLVEQFGFFGGFTVIMLYGTLGFGILKKIKECLRKLDSTSARFKMYVLVGVFGMIFVQVTINIGMNLGLLPITGITLPFISYGGSSLVSILIALAFIL